MTEEKSSESTPVDPASTAAPAEAVPAEVPAVDPVAEAQAEAAKYKDQLLRTAADFDNFRKRTRRELEDASRRGRDELLKELLPVFDNLERATAHADTNASGDGAKALAEGIGLVMRQFADTLRKLGVERVEALGQPFDPSVHEAIQHMETADFEPGTIAAEIQAGYRDGERLIRPALVVVAKRPPEAAPDSSSGSTPENHS